MLAFGSPLGLESSVTMGVVSAVARQLTPEDPMIYIQTDAPINPGNSGGPLVDTDGRLVGINTLIYSQSGGSEGIGFAAPSNIVRNVVQQIRKNGRVRRGEIGVNAQTITPLMAEALGLTSSGVMLADVMPGGPAAKAGLEPGDIVLTLDGKPMENGRQFRINVYTRGIGEQVAVEVGAAADDDGAGAGGGARERHRPARGADRTQQVIRTLGIVALDLTRRSPRCCPNCAATGAVVARSRRRRRIRSRASSRPATSIYAMNGKTITGGDELKTATAALQPGAAAVLLIERESTLMYLAFRVER